MNPSRKPFRDRKLGQWSLAYLGTAVVLYEVLGQVGDNFGWPGWIMRVVTVLLGAGFFVVVTLAWFHGEKGQQRVTLGEVVILGAVLVAGGAGVYSVLWDDVPPPVPITGTDEDAVRGRTIAVLPLVNRRGDPDQEYFSDGISEELMLALSRVPGLRLAARTSSFAFKGKAVGMDSIARALGVRHVLTGSVEISDDRVRVDVTLDDVVANVALWNEIYFRPLADVFQIQRDIARAVVAALPLDPVLLAGGWSPPEYSTTPEAHDLYLRGREAWNRRTGPELLRAIELFEQALEIDADFAPAWAALAETYVILPGYTAVSTRTSWNRLLEASSRALALDSTLVAASTALGYGTAWMERDVPAGIEILDQALALDPDYANALHWSGEILAIVGDFEESMRRFALALELDPLSNVTRADYGQALQLAGRQDEAIEVLEALLTEHPGYLIGEYWLIYPSLLAGNFERAEELVRSVSGPAGLDADDVATAVRAIAGTATREEGLAALDAQPRSGSGVGLTLICGLYGLLGGLDQGFDIMEIDPLGFQGTQYLRVHPAFEPYRSHPRFERFLDLLGPR